MTVGMDRNTGKRIDGLPRIAQRIADVLTTPKGARVMRRDYGSILPKLIDMPDNAATRLLLGAASAAAIARWIPELSLTSAKIIDGGADGRATLAIAGYRLDLPKQPDFSLNISL